MFVCYVYVFRYYISVAVLEVLKNHYDLLLNALPDCAPIENFKLMKLLEKRYLTNTADSMFPTIPESKQEIFDFLIKTSKSDWQLLGLSTIIESLILPLFPSKLVAVEVFRNGNFVCVVCLDTLYISTVHMYVWYSLKATSLSLKADLQAYHSNSRFTVSSPQVEFYNLAIIITLYLNCDGYLCKGILFQLKVMFYKALYCINNNLLFCPLMFL